MPPGFRRINDQNTNMSLLTPKTIVITSAPNRNSSELPKTVSLSTAVMDEIYQENEGGGPRKRRRLNHLTPEEKLMRRKLKNRVAAQTARDRKKDLMSNLESQLAKLIEENKKLQKENAALRNQSGMLVQENSNLKERLGFVSGTSGKPESEYPGSAVPFAPLPQDQTRTQSHLMMPLATSYLMSLLSLMQKDEPAREKGSGLSNIISPIIKTEPTEPAKKMVGPSATELESLNELIKFDHIYYKIEPSEVQNDTTGSKDNQKVIVVCHSNDSQKSDNLINIHITKDDEGISNSSPVDNCIVIDDDNDVVTTNNNTNSTMDCSDVLPDELLEDLQSILANDLEGQFVLDNTVDPISQDGHGVSALCIKSESNGFEVPTITSKRNKRKLSDLIDISDVPPSISDDMLHLNDSIDVASDSGFSSDSLSEAASPCGSDLLGGLGEDPWEESFMELFPTLA